MSKKLTDKRINEIKNSPIVYDEDIPEFTDEQLKEFKPAFPRPPLSSPTKKTISIKIDTDILEALEAEGEIYQTRINSILRQALFG
ncbi:BrnA antitoxin family protein [Treponema sp. OMZ 840]|uniref:BrnA antitoxin family protein n=1 Tax=Treponema sp. OMZ 840 TaxID=244313 RepID=UPI003D919D3B